MSDRLLMADLSLTAATRDLVQQLCSRLTNDTIANIDGGGELNRILIDRHHVDTAVRHHAVMVPALADEPDLPARRRLLGVSGRGRKLADRAAGSSRANNEPRPRLGPR
ncbi:hypothetical protein [Marinitenerispora sediminis]|uniref:Uncharacterized protein n=1 Tax=Marinitenerispora sediminis TaxID=1931232 RepID=A0A368T9Y3_9ACTN|nr:hypothetical protein [Marinitenerispora sediminis]RCV56855.1 hypothetical protein DEF28_02945 [Marinitenerispora sediminis]RCV59030.1 hypothetical protein DEF23_07925 [Marinitenerispora sediminis]RCV61564.1 hypothetical protein DEF24_04115 [Marinitenerispora sediminis]